MKCWKIYFMKTLTKKTKQNENMWKNYFKKIHWQRKKKFIWNFIFFKKIRVSNALMHIIINFVILFNESINDKISNYLLTKLISSKKKFSFVIRKSIFFFNFTKKYQIDNIFIFRNTFKLNLNFFLLTKNLIIKKNVFSSMHDNFSFFLMWLCNLKKLFWFWKKFDQ